ncbi:MAG: methyltransferase [Pseudomonadota bacterium]
MPVGIARVDEAAEAFTEDTLLDGRVLLRQPRKGNRAGVDGLILAASVPAAPGDHVVDFGAGSGVAGLAVAARVSDINVTGVDNDPAMVALAADNYARNGANGRAVMLDLCAGASVRKAACETTGLEAATVDRVLANPPFDLEGTVRTPPTGAREAAHVAGPDLLDTWSRAAAALLKPRGTFTLIQRAAHLEIVLAAFKDRFGDLVVRPVHPRADEPAIRVVVTGTKGRRGRLSLAPPLILHPPRTGAATEATYTVDADAVLRGMAAI